MEVTNFGIALAFALNILHENNIVHRDLHEKNVFFVDIINQPKSCKICDFGTTDKVFAANVPRFCLDIGMPPELQTKNIVSPKADVY